MLVLLEVLLVFDELVEGSLLLVFLLFLELLIDALHLLHFLLFLQQFLLLFLEFKLGLFFFAFLDIIHETGEALVTLFGDRALLAFVVGVALSKQCVSVVLAILLIGVFGSEL